jgi:hypothetical protein
VEWYLTNLNWVAKISEENDFQAWMDKNYGNGRVGFEPAKQSDG